LIHLFKGEKRYRHFYHGSRVEIFIFINPEIEMGKSWSVSFITVNAGIDKLVPENPGVGKYGFQGIRGFSIEEVPQKCGVLCL